MKKILSCLFAAFSLASFVQAQDLAEESFLIDDSVGFLSVKPALFLPTSNSVKEIYGSSLSQITLEGNFKVHEDAAKVYVWLDASYICADGHSTGYESNHTHVTLVPVTLGVKYDYPLNFRINVYLGAGPSYSFISFRDHSPYVQEKIAKSQLGAIIKSGLTYQLSSTIAFEGFVNYSYQPFDFAKDDISGEERQNVDFSSFQIGLGLNWKF